MQFCLFQEKYSRYFPKLTEPRDPTYTRSGKQALLCQSRHMKQFHSESSVRRWDVLKHTDNPIVSFQELLYALQRAIYQASIYSYWL